MTYRCPMRWILLPQLFRAREESWRLWTRKAGIKVWPHISLIWRPRPFKIPVGLWVSLGSCGNPWGCSGEARSSNTIWETVVQSKSCFVKINLGVGKREKGVKVWNPVRIAVGMVEREREVVVWLQLQKYPEGRVEENNTQTLADLSDWLPWNWGRRERGSPGPWPPREGWQHLVQKGSQRHEINEDKNI